MNFKGVLLRGRSGPRLNLSLCVHQLRTQLLLLAACGFASALRLVVRILTEK